MINKPTTEKRIQEFMLAKTPIKPLPKQYEIYIALDGRLYGYAVDHLSERQLIQGYEHVWRFAREDVKITVVSNSPHISIEHGKHFCASLFAGKIVTISIDLVEMKVTRT